MCKEMLLYNFISKGATILDVGYKWLKTHIRQYL